MTCLFVEQLTVIDASYLCPRRGLVGESWIVDLELEGVLDEQSMVLDFGAVKKELKRAIDDGPDHTLIVPIRAAGQVSEPLPDGRIRTSFESAVGRIEHRAPAEAVTLLDAAEVNAPSLAAHLEAQLGRLLPVNVSAVRLHLRHEVIDGDWYRYTHGLAKHRGACQRIAHGHRSRLAIRIDGQRDPEPEARWAKRWADIYLYTGAHRVFEGDGRLGLAYLAPEGLFELELPSDRCYQLGETTDSTVEEIAGHLAAAIAAERPGAQVEVRAYEGVMKGAIARLP